MAPARPSDGMVRPGLGPVAARFAALQVVAAAVDRQAVMSEGSLPSGTEPSGVRSSKTSPGREPTMDAACRRGSVQAMSRTSGPGAPAPPAANLGVYRNAPRPASVDRPAPRGDPRGPGCPMAPRRHPQRPHSAADLRPRPAGRDRLPHGQGRRRPSRPRPGARAGKSHGNPRHHEAHARGPAAHARPARPRPPARSRRPGRTPGPVGRGSRRTPALLGTARFSAKKSSRMQNIARDTAHRAERVRRTARMAETSPCTRDRRRGGVRADPYQAAFCGRPRARTSRPP